MDIKISPFESNNIVLFEKLCIIDANAFGIENSWSPNNFSINLLNKLELSFIAYDNTIPIGYIICSSYILNNKKTAHLNRIAILSDYKKINVGNTLIKKFESAAKDLGITTITLEFNSALNVAHFYEKCGYSQIQNKQEISTYVSEKKKESKLDDFLAFKKKIYIKTI